MPYYRLLIALLLGSVVVANVGCHFHRLTDPNPKPLLSGEYVRQPDVVRPVIHTSHDSR